MPIKCIIDVHMIVMLQLYYLQGGRFAILFSYFNCNTHTTNTIQYNRDNMKTNSKIHNIYQNYISNLKLEFSLMQVHIHLNFHHIFQLSDNVKMCPILAQLHCI